MRRPAGFTLIELLLAVAIIAILAAVALPNLQEASIRTRFAASHDTMRSLTVAIESYRVDNRAYPPATGVGDYFAAPFFASPVSTRLVPVTTPVAYMASVPSDQFPPSRSIGTGILDPYDTYDYVDAAADPVVGPGLTSGGAWRLASAGPDKLHAFGGRTASDPAINEAGVDYDPTNGTVSAGDVVRVGPADTRTDEATDLSNPRRPGILRVPEYRYQWQ